ncbi:MAG: bifunctional glutamate N-acetyltransferase/amino-acid acetyltransferase ArgJ [Dorea sp.]|jgi:glutamate N-acetyltransferase/amino-acid acetyltransferase|nr:bifunctional glutamate N-acetyltransferase/amino-acid acetyltransferase ArgJ [Dorea sp.]
MEIIKGGVTAAKGYEAASTAAGIKYKDRTDMAMIYSRVPCAAAGTFTTNVVKAAPVKWDQQVIAGGAAVQAVIVNSGIANACTGAEGFGYCKETAAAAAEALGISSDGVLIGSTGVIGKQIPIDRLTAGIRVLAEKKNDTLENGTEAAKAIMTTDTFEKELAVTIEAGGKTVTIGGMAKGSGMIHPNMCTMLAFITTDAVISKETLQKALSEDIKDTYNMISVDGDTSTNDTVVLLANGLAENQEIMEGTEDYRKFQEALHAVNEYLAKKIAGDGEGATALFEVKAVGCESTEQARTLAKSIVCSNLTKTAIAGHDANWGRILCAMGYSGASFDPEKVDLFFESKAGRIQIIENGTAVDYSEEEATKILSEAEVTAVADVKMGGFAATAWGCDLTHGYIEINADYRS